MIGLVLCGGLATRMGKDKGLITTGARTWAQNAFELLSAAALQVLLSVNPNQAEVYSRHFPYDSLLPDDPSLALKGPLLGILSAHQVHPGEDLLVLACDMPFVNSGLISQLIDAHATHPNYEAYVFMLDGKAEPLCAIYSADALSAVRSLYQDQKQSNYSLKFILDRLEVCKIPVQERQKQFFRNINHAEDLNSL